MAKKQQERSELEHLRAENRNLKSEIRHLKKELARKQKREHQYSDLEQRAQEIELAGQEEQVVVNNVKCPECSGNLSETSIGVRILITCDKCTYRKTKKQ